MRVALIEPDIKSSAHTVFAGNNALEPLGLEYLSGVANEAGWEAKVFVERLVGDQLLNEIVDFRPDLIGLTFLTCNSAHGLALAREIKRNLPCKIVIGGYHASAVPYELAHHDVIDWVIVGEGEQAFELILKSFDEREFSQSRRKVLKSDRISHLSELPRPKRNETVLSGCRLLGVMFPPPSQQSRVAVVSTSRGCPNSCEFCSSGPLWGNKVVYGRSPEDVVDEVKTLVCEHNVDAIFLGDLSFNASREHVVAICNELIDSRINVPWYCMCCMANLNEDILSIMYEAGCRKIGIGVESPLFEDRRTIKSGFVATDDELMSGISIAQGLGMFVKGYFMVGYPWETEASLATFEDKLMQFSFDEIKISFYTPFPGTPAYSKYRSLLLTEDWSIFDSVSQPIIRNQNVPPDLLIAWRQDVFRRFYSSYHYKMRIKAACSRNPQLSQSYRDLGRQLDEALSLSKTFAEELARTTL